MDTVEWAMPGLMEALCGSDVIAFAPDMESEESATDDATRYVNHVLFERNDGFVTLHDAIKSCLITRIGVVKAYCDKSEVVKEETYREVSELEVQALAADPEVEIIEQTPSPYPQPGPDGMPTPAFDVLCRRRHEARKFVWEGVPPEEVRISKDCRTIEKVRFIEHRGPRTRSDLISEGWPQNEVDRLPKWGQTDTEDQLQRHAYDQSEDTNDTADPSQEEVEVSESYLRIDYDGDGVAEYRRVLKAHTYVHSNEVVDDHPFAVFAPILMPYKLIGLSFWDLVEDLQRIKTALNRQVLDNVYLSNNPRYGYKQGQVNLDQLLNPVPGGAVAIKPEAGPDAIVPLIVPFVAGAGLELINATDQVRDKRTGVTELNSALNAASLAKGSVGSEGVQSLMQAGAQRQKLIARVLAETGLKRAYLLMLKLVCQYQDRDAQLRVNGRWMQINPREWRTNYRVTVQVGLGSVDKAQQVANLSLLGQAQEKAAAVGIVQPENVYNLLTKLARTLGEREPEKYFTPPQEAPQNQGPPPEVLAEQAKQQGAMQLEQLRQQGAKELAVLNGQIQVQIAETDAQRDIEVENAKQEAQAQQAQLESQNQREIALFKAQLEADNDRYKAELEAQTELQKAMIAHRQAVDVADTNAEAGVINGFTGGEA